jgi:hypothetical protein
LPTERLVNAVRTGARHAANNPPTCDSGARCCAFPLRDRLSLIASVGRSRPDGRRPAVLWHPAGRNRRGNGRRDLGADAGDNRSGQFGGDRRDPGGCRTCPEADPVFALLEVHKATWARFEEQDGSDHETFTHAAGRVDAALEEITLTPPTTVAGMRAVIEYLVELDGHEDYLPTLLRSSILRSPLLAG